MPAHFVPGPGNVDAVLREDVLAVVHTPLVIGVRNAELLAVHAHRGQAGCHRVGLEEDSGDAAAFELWLLDDDRDDPRR